MTREEAIYTLKNAAWLGTHEERVETEQAIEMAIETLSAEAVPQIDQYKKGFEDAKRAFLVEYARESENMRKRIAQLEVMLNAQKAISAEAVEDWIPVKYHEITEDERKENGYPKDWVYFLDCEMPSDDQEILVQARNGTIRWDVCYEDDGYSLDSGWDWKDDIIAWMPLPEPYKGGDDE